VRSPQGETQFQPSVSRTLAAGLGGGVTFFVTAFLTFFLVGSGLDQRSGPLFDPALQSPKLIRVWTEEPVPLFATAPHVVFLEYVLIGMGYALILRSVATAWPESAWSRTWRLAGLIWLSCAFFEFLGPLNLLSEPLGLVALELAFWALAALAEAAVVVFVFRHTRRGGLMVQPS
jgi:hypothetical protein